MSGPETSLLFLHTVLSSLLYPSYRLLQQSLLLCQRLWVTEECLDLLLPLSLILLGQDPPGNFRLVIHHRLHLAPEIFLHQIVVDVLYIRCAHVVLVAVDLNVPDLMDNLCTLPSILLFFSALLTFMVAPEEILICHARYHGVFSRILQCGLSDVAAVMWVKALESLNAFIGYAVHL